MPTLLEALETFPYAGGSVRRGETFLPKSDRDAQVLVAAHLAKARPSAPVTPRKPRRKPVPA